LAILQAGASDMSDGAGLRQARDGVLASGCRNVAEAVPYQLLHWLGEEAYSHLRSQDDKHADLLQQSLAHEAWFRWQQGLWDGPASLAPAPLDNLAAEVMPPLRFWDVLGGAMQLHIPLVAAHASAIVSGKGAPLCSHAVKLVQLKLASRHLVRTSGGNQAGYDARVVAEWRAALLVAVSTLAAYLSDMQAGKTQLQEALGHLSAAHTPADVAQAPVDVLQTITGALGTCAHPGLAQLVQPVLLPATRILLCPSSAASDPTGERAGDAFSTCALLLSCVANLRLPMPLQGWLHVARPGLYSAWHVYTSLAPHLVWIPPQSMPCIGLTS